MTSICQIEHGKTGRIIYARVRPNEDLLMAVEKICLQESIDRCFVRGSLGSLTDAAVQIGSGKIRYLKGPAVEVVSLTGEVRPDKVGNPVATLTGMISDSAGGLAGGVFVRGQNPVCITFEVTLEEWLVNSDPVPCEQGASK